MVMTDLAKGMLTVKSKTKFISYVAAAIFQFKSFPGKYEYEHVYQVIISKYPFLKSSSGTGYVSIIVAYLLFYISMKSDHLNQCHDNIFLCCMYCIRTQKVCK